VAEPLSSLDRSINTKTKQKSEKPKNPSLRIDIGFRQPEPAFEEKLRGTDLACAFFCRDLPSALGVMLGRGDRVLSFHVLTGLLVCCVVAQVEGSEERSGVRSFRTSVEGRQMVSTQTDTCGPSPLNCSTCCWPGTQRCDAGIPENCTCDYGWTGDQCSEPLVKDSAMSGWLAIRVTATIGCCGVLVWALVQGVLFLCRAGRLEHKHLTPALAYGLVVIASLVRVFYYNIDPFAWNRRFATCVTFSFDYVSQGVAGCAYLFVVLSWSVTMERFERTNQSKAALGRFFRFLIAFCIVAAVVIVLTLPASAATACICRFDVCSNVIPDSVFFIPFIVCIGLGTIFGVIAALRVLWFLRNFKSNRKAHLVTFTGFVLMSGAFELLVVACSTTLFLFYTFRRDNTMEPWQFLLVETAQACSLLLELVAVLVVVARGQKGRKERVYEPSEREIEMSEPLNKT
jgi:hypothetical protein